MIAYNQIEGEDSMELDRYERIINKFNEPFEMIQKTLSFHDDNLQQIRDITNTANSLLKKQVYTHEVALSYFNMVKSINPNTNILFDNSKVYYEDILRTTEIMNGITNNPGLEQAYNSIINKIQNSLPSSLINPSNELVDSVEKLLATLADSNNLINNFNFFNEVNFTEDITADVLKPLSESLIVNEERSLEEKVDNLTQITKDNNRRVKDIQNQLENSEQRIDWKSIIIPFIFEKVVMYLIAPLLFPWVQPLIDSSQSITHEAPTHILNKVEYKFKDSFSDNAYDSYRIVKKDNLEIREYDRVNSKILGYVHFAEPVSVVTKNRNWTKIKIIIDDEIIEGWVFTRYLKKIE